MSGVPFTCVYHTSEGPALMHVFAAGGGRIGGREFVDWVHGHVPLEGEAAEALLAAFALARGNSVDSATGVLFDFAQQVYDRAYAGVIASGILNPAEIP